jgi:hypothetical protein
MSGVRPERNYIRDLSYSIWHRTRVPAHCYCTDLDWIEWRADRGIVAFIESKIGTDRVTKFQREVFTELSEKTGIPFYVVRHNRELTEFMVMRLSDNFTWQFNELEYINWLEAL